MRRRYDSASDRPDFFMRSRTRRSREAWPIAAASSPIRWRNRSSMVIIDQSSGFGEQQITHWFREQALLVDTLDGAVFVHDHRTEPAGDADVRSGIGKIIHFFAQQSRGLLRNQTQQPVAPAGIGMV